MRIRAFLNEERDEQGRPVGMLDGYASGHSLRLALDADQERDDPDLDVCEWMFWLLNVGDDPDYNNGVAQPLADEYRFHGNRSLSVGDVVAVDDEFYACGRVGWVRIDTPEGITA